MTMTCRGKTKNVIGLLEDETDGEKITNFLATAPKIYDSEVQNNNYKIKDSEFIKAKEVKQSLN